MARVFVGPTALLTIRIIPSLPMGVIYAPTPTTEGKGREEGEGEEGGEGLGRRVAMSICMLEWRPLFL